MHPSLPEGRPPWRIATVFWFARVPARHWKYNTFGSSWNVGKGLPTLRLEPVRHSRRHWKYNTHGHAELVVLCMNTALNVLGASVPTLDAQHPMSPDRHLVRSRCYALSVAFEVLRHWKYNPLRLCSRHRCRLARTTSAAYQTILSTLHVQYPPPASCQLSYVDVVAHCQLGSGLSNGGRTACQYKTEGSRPNEMAQWNAGRATIRHRESSPSSSTEPVGLPVRTTSDGGTPSIRDREYRLLVSAAERLQCSLGLLLIAVCEVSSIESTDSATGVPEWPYRSRELLLMAP